MYYVYMQPSNSVMIFSNFSTFYYKFHSPQVKRYLISTSKNIKRELLHWLSNYIRIKKILGNWEIEKSQNLVQKHAPGLPLRNKTLAIAVKKYSKADIKVFWCRPIFPNFYTLLQILCPGLYVRISIGSYSRESLKGSLIPVTREQVRVCRNYC